MAVVIAGDGQGEGVLECPILREWVKLDAVVQRATKGTVALLTSKDLSRDTVADNHEIIGPLVTHLGTSP